MFPRRLGAHLAVFDIGDNALTRPLAGIAVTAATRGLDREPVARAQYGHGLRWNDVLRAIGAQDDRARHPPITAARQTLRRAEMPLATMGQGDFAFQDFVLADNAKPPTEQPGPARIAS